VRRVVARVPLSDAAGQPTALSVQVDGAVADLFPVDTGIGWTIRSPPLLDRVGGGRTGRTFTGKRRSGGSVTVPATGPSFLEVGGHRVGPVPAGLPDRELLEPQPITYGAARRWILLGR
jgi:hypothetical protein